MKIKDITIFTTEEINDLPGELRKQLSVKTRVGKMQRLVDIIASSDTPVSFNYLLVQYYLIYNEVFKRNALLSYLWRLKNKGRIKVIKKGVYAIDKG